MHLFEKITDPFTPPTLEIIKNLFWQFNTFECSLWIFSVWFNLWKGDLKNHRSWLGRLLSKSPHTNLQIEAKNLLLSSSFFECCKNATFHFIRRRKVELKFVSTNYQNFCLSLQIEAVNGI